MSWTPKLSVVLLLVLLPAEPARAQVDPAPIEVIAVVQVQGNNVTPDDEVLVLAGVSPGDPFTPDTLGTVRRRLVDTGRFEGVEVRRRFASIADPSRIALVIVVDEHAVKIVPSGVPAGGPDTAAPPRIVRRGPFGNVMWLPIVDVEDGYAPTFGVVAAYPGIAGDRSRLAVPLSWGGRRRAGVEFDRAFVGGPVSRLRAGASIEQRRHPAFDERDQRRRVFGRLEKNFVRAVRAGVTGAWEQVIFASEGDRFRSIGADISFDTRLDPGFPRNAIDLTASWTHVAGEHTRAFSRVSTGARAYVGLFRQSVLAARLEHDRSTRSLPRYFKPMLGGWSSLRGFAAGTYAGDFRAAASLELRLPVSSPLSLAKTGVSVFVDAGKTWDVGSTFGDAPSRIGVGAGVWFAATAVQAGLSVAYGRGGGTRVNVGLGVAF